MPIFILWAEAAAPFAAAVHRWLANMARSTFLLDKWLKARVEQARQLDRQTAGFPIFFYHNTALTARLADVQAGSLLTVPVMGVGAHVERALDQWNVARDVRNQARSANLPIELLRMIEEMSVDILASLDRFERPTADMYDPGERTASDLIGLAALAFRTVGANRDGLKTTAARLVEALRIGKYSEDAPASKSKGIDATPLPLDLRIDELNRYVVGALLVIPAVSALLQSMGRDALIVLRYAALAKFEELEALVYASRQKMLIGFRNGMRAATGAGLQLFARIGGLATGCIGAFTTIAESMMRGMTDGVGILFGQLQTFWNGVFDAIGSLFSFSDAIMSVDVGKILHLALVTIEDAIEWIGDELYFFTSPEGYEAPDQFPVTIGELLLSKGPGARAGREMRTAIYRLTNAVRDVVLFDQIDSLVADATDGKVHVKGHLKGLEDLIGALALPAWTFAWQPVLAADIGGVPDLVADVVTPLRNGLSDAVAKIGKGADTAVGDIFGTAQTRLTGIGAEFGKASAKAASMPLQEKMQDLGRDADATVRALFDDQTSAARKTGLDSVAVAFGAWLQGGFDTIANLATGYIRFMVDEWLVHIAEGRDLPVQLTPTSPKRLLERAELGRVHMPRMRIVAGRRATDRPLAEQVADEFRGAVQNAYRTGLGRMAEFAALAA